MMTKEQFEKQAEELLAILELDKDRFEFAMEDLAEAVSGLCATLGRLANLAEAGKELGLHLEYEVPPIPEVLNPTTVH